MTSASPRSARSTATLGRTHSSGPRSTTASAAPAAPIPSSGAAGTTCLAGARGPTSSSVVAAGLAIYGCELVAILQARKRRNLDWGIKYFLTALALLLPVTILGVMLAWPPPVWFTLSVLGNCHVAELRFTERYGWRLERYNEG